MQRALYKPSVPGLNAPGQFTAYLIQSRVKLVRRHQLAMEIRPFVFRTVKRGAWQFINTFRRAIAKVRNWKIPGHSPIRTNCCCAPDDSSEVPFYFSSFSDFIPAFQ